MGTLTQIRANFTLNRREQQSCAAICHCLFDLIDAHRLLTLENVILCFVNQMFFIKHKGNRDDLLLFSTVNGHDAVIRNGRNLLRAVIVHFIDLAFILGILLQCSLQNAALHDRILERPALLWIVTDSLSNDVLGTLYGILPCLDFLRHILGSFFLNTAFLR